MTSRRRRAATGDLPSHATLPARMRRVLSTLDAVRKSPDPDPVHELRVAIRRCRSIASIMKEVDPHPGWPSVRRLPRKLFRALGELRDVHMLEQGVAQLVPEPLRTKLLQSLHARAAERRTGVMRAIDAFDGKAWKRASSALKGRLDLVPADGAAAGCLALERFEALRRLHGRARRTPTPENWHLLRIALKQFRYVVESILPAHHAAWYESLKQMQDLLGTLHDLHAVDAFLSTEAAAADAEEIGVVRAAIQQQTQSRIDQYRRRTRGRSSVLAKWRSALPRRSRIEAANSARFRATSKAGDSNVQRTTRIVRLALDIFDALARAGVSSRLCERRTRLMLRTAARLHGIRADNRRLSRQKAARRFVRSSTVPVGWTAAEWDVVGWTIRYHRGAEPKAGGSFARLPADRQELVRGLAGVLRLARALRRCGAHTVLSGTAYADGDVRLRAIGLVDTRKNAARLAAAKHLLETQLRRHVILERA